MPTLTKKDLSEIKKLFDFDFQMFKNFVETGTNYGNTIHNVIDDFENIYTIELSEKFYGRAVESFKNNEKVRLFLGDSMEILPKVLKEVFGPTIFFLDGHFSSEDTAQGTKDVPLLEELRAIIEDFRFESLIIIDDYRLFGTKYNEDWSEVTESNILEIVEPRIETKYVLQDRFIIKLKN